MSAPQLLKEIDEFKSQIASEALGIVNEKMPLKILHLNGLLKGTPNFKIDFPEVHPPSSKKRKLENDTVDVSIPSNTIIMDLIGLLKKELLELIEMLNTVKIWIQLNIPQIEDGNNFGVGIQEETVNELSRAESDTFGVLESMAKYFANRARLVCKAKKYPDVEDYRNSIHELDEKEYVTLRLCALDLRNNFAILHDMITKNLEKLKKPRASNHLSTIF